MDRKLLGILGPRASRFFFGHFDGASNHIQAWGNCPGSSTPHKLCELSEIIWCNCVVCTGTRRKSNKCPKTKKETLFWKTSLKFKLKKLSILPRFYFHDASKQLKTNFHTNFRFRRVLRFVIEYAWISKLLPQAAQAHFTREGCNVCRVFLALLRNHCYSFNRTTNRY